MVFISEWLPVLHSDVARPHLQASLHEKAAMQYARTLKVERDLADFRLVMDRAELAMRSHADITRKQVQLTRFLAKVNVHKPDVESYENVKMKAAILPNLWEIFFSMPFDSDNEAHRVLLELFKTEYASAVSAVKAEIVRTAKKATESPTKYAAILHRVANRITNQAEVDRAALIRYMVVELNPMVDGIGELRGLVNKDQWTRVDSALAFLANSPQAAIILRNLRCWHRLRFDTATFYQESLVSS
ncbi:hypothetical protein BCR44DRAFT_62860 [Catenaria anguillulae PL171]|uniref:Uncharacterized protein n=1 Tax=Catenaria anguillulae PL171 TaxID=765915 RepID=A0A1Y2H6E6_9FUNG|nr:hypothetical protein BCR44DRAFT_62860 [Catenaria anguillulae PL171]